MDNILSIDEFARCDEVSNQVHLIGYIGDLNKDYMYCIQGECYYITYIRVGERLLPISLSSKFPALEFVNKKVLLTGKISNKFYNYLDEDKKKRRDVQNYIFVEDLEVLSGENKDFSINRACVKGEIASKSEAVKGSSKSSLRAIVKIDNVHNKREFIPVVFYNRDARYADSLKIGSRIKLTGKIVPHLKDKSKFVVRSRGIILSEK